jgi:hypothetical protein
MLQQQKEMEHSDVCLSCVEQHWHSDTPVLPKWERGLQMSLIHNRPDSGCLQSINSTALTVCTGAEESVWESQEAWSTQTGDDQADMRGFWWAYWRPVGGRWGHAGHVSSAQSSSRQWPLRRHGACAGVLLHADHGSCDWKLTCTAVAKGPCLDALQFHRQLRVTGERIILAGMP